MSIFCIRGTFSGAIEAKRIERLGDCRCPQDTGYHKNSHIVNHYSDIIYLLSDITLVCVSFYITRYAVSSPGRDDLPIATKIKTGN